MIFNKKIKNKITRDYFFYSGNFNNINSKYFIDKINKGIKEKTNLNRQTNLKSEMTSWNFFNNDLEFYNLLWPIFDFIDEELNPFENRYYLFESWGFKSSLGDYTIKHDHDSNNTFVSGVIYLNEHSQLLEFPQIKQTIKPDKGNFGIFSQFLEHKCKRNLHKKEKYGISFNIAKENNN
jgi:hypothetical protein